MGESRRIPKREKTISKKRIKKLICLVFVNILSVFCDYGRIGRLYSINNEIQFFTIQLRIYRQ